MNHLSHAYLSCGDQYTLVGNLVTDFLTKKEMDDFPESFQFGIALHKEIDRFMDNHSITKEATGILKQSQKRYAPVSIDLLWDYYLAQNWSKYSGQSLAEFNKTVYDMITASLDQMPEKNKEKFEFLISRDFLAPYLDINDFEKVLIRMDKRANFSSNFIGIIEDIQKYGAQFDQLFTDFFPLAIGHVAHFCDC